MCLRVSVRCVLELPYRQCHWRIPGRIASISIRTWAAADSLSRCHRLRSFLMLLSRNVICSSSGVGLFWFVPATGAVVLTLTITLLHMRICIERFVGEIISIWFSQFERVTNDIWRAWERKICLDAQNKLNQISTGCLSFSKTTVSVCRSEKLEKRYGRFPWAKISCARVFNALSIRFSIQSHLKPQPRLNCSSLCLAVYHSPEMRVFIELDTIRISRKVNHFGAFSKRTTFRLSMLCSFYRFWHGTHFTHHFRAQFHWQRTIRAQY